jgi:hypothetical protein
MNEYRKIWRTALWIVLVFVLSCTTDVQVDSANYRYKESAYRPLISTQAGGGGDLDGVSTIRSNKHAVPHHTVITGSMTICDKGHYHIMGGLDSICTECAAGTYNTLTGMQDVSGCIACSAGTYSSSVAATTSSVCTTCAANTYSASIGATSSSSCVPCGVLMASAAGATSCSSLLGNIELFAGGYADGNSGDGGAATSAYLGMTMEVVSDVARGRVFILDQSPYDSSNSPNHDGTNRIR